MFHKKYNIIWPPNGIWPVDIIDGKNLDEYDEVKFLPEPEFKACGQCGKEFEDDEGECYLGYCEECAEEKQKR